MLCIYLEVPGVFTVLSQKPSTLPNCFCSASVAGAISLHSLADPTSSSTLGFYYLHHRGIRIQNWVAQLFGSSRGHGLSGKDLQSFPAIGSESAETFTQLPPLPRSYPFMSVMVKTPSRPFRRTLYNPYIIPISRIFRHGSYSPTTV